MSETESFELNQLLPGDVIVIKSDSHDFTIAVALVHSHAVMGMLSEMTEGELAGSASIALLGSCLHDLPITKCPFSPMVLIQGESVLMEYNGAPDKYFVAYCRIERGGTIIFEAGIRL